MKFKVYEVEDKTIASGLELKKLVLQGEGKQYPDKNVTMWADHPLFMTIKAGDSIEGELDIKDSKVANPHGGFYKNKTLLKQGQMPSKAAEPSQSSDFGARAYNLLQLEVMPALKSIIAWQEKQDMLIEKGEAAVDKGVKSKLEDWEPRDLDGSPF